MPFVSSYAGAESERRRDFLAANVAAQTITATIPAATEMSATLLNSGTVGLGAVEDVGFVDVDGLDESENIANPVFVDVITSPLPEL